MCIFTQGGGSAAPQSAHLTGALGAVLRYLGECLHGERPLGDQLVPAGERRQDREEVVPQIPADVDVEVALNPRDYQSLYGRKKICAFEPNSEAA